MGLVIGFIGGWATPGGVRRHKSSRICTKHAVSSQLDRHLGHGQSTTPSGALGPSRVRSQGGQQRLWRPRYTQTDEGPVHLTSACPLETATLLRRGPGHPALVRIRHRARRVRERRESASPPRGGDRGRCFGLGDDPTVRSMSRRSTNLLAGSHRWGEGLSRPGAKPSSTPTRRWMSSTSAARR